LSLINYYANEKIDCIPYSSVFPSVKRSCTRPYYQWCSNQRKNLPLAGVSVGTPDGKSGTQTDNDGKYSLKIPATARVLIFSYVNYQSATLAVGKLLNLSVSLKPADTKMEEVVVVGYGTQQKKAFTGSSTKVDAKQFANLVSPSVDKQLAGRAAGCR
jgi:hypothetical protein